MPSYVPSFTFIIANIYMLGLVSRLNGLRSGLSLFYSFSFLKPDL
jgi:hypothetical protein